MINSKKKLFVSKNDFHLYTHNKKYFLHFFSHQVKHSKKLLAHMYKNICLFHSFILFI